MKLQLVDRLAELPYRVRPAARLTQWTWSLSPDERAAVTVRWPSRYQWPPAANMVETQKAGLENLGVLRVAETEQKFKGVIMLECVVRGRPHFVSLDLSDYHDFINWEAVEQSSLYFKCQYRRTGYNHRNIIPGGYMVTGNDYYKYYLPFRNQYVANRRVDVVGRFGYTFQGEIRRKAVKLLTDASDLNYLGTSGKVRYSRFIREAASARMCLQLPGNGPFSYRVVEFLGLRTCMVSIRLATELHVPLEPGVHYVEVADDLSDLVDKCRYYRDHDAERERIAQAGQEYFDRYLHRDQLATYYVRTMLDRLS
jgi:hypothetical protein